MEGMRRGRATFLCLNVSFLWGCQLVCLCVSRLPSAPLPKSPVECRDGAVRGQQGTSAGAETGGGGSNERKRIGSARGKWGGGRGKRGRRQEGRKPKKAGWHRRAGVGGFGDGSSPWVSISSCPGVGLCALCFSSYCLGIPVGTLPAPKLGSHHHPSHSDQRQRGTSAE